MVFIEDKKEVSHIVEVLRETQKALQESNAFKLQMLSDQIIHSASIYQHTDLILTTTIIYCLNKLVARRDHLRVKNWQSFVKKFNSEIDKAINELGNENVEEFARHIQHAKDLIITISPNSRADIEDVIKNASINKAGKIYEHGISLSRTASLLGISQWDLAEYIGQRGKKDDPHLSSIDVKKRAAKAMEFFSW